MSSEERYVHDPDSFRDDEDGGQAETADADEGDGDRPGGMGTRGWVLVGVVLLAFFVVPAVILLRPPQLPFRVAFLVLPLLPAGLLGATAVWAMAARSQD